MNSNNINLINARCTNCGAMIDINDIPESGILICPACDTTFVTENAVEFAAMKEEKANRIKILRQLLKEAVDVNNIKGIRDSSEKIKEIIPNDYTATYYYAYSENVLGKYHYIENFYKSISDLCTSEEICEILNHVIKYSDLRDRSNVEGYIMALDNIDNQKYLTEYKAEFNRRKVLEENYDDIPRDIFICYRSIDNAVAQKVMTILENDGNKCWIAARNLRPNDSENYWDNIKRAIKSCSLFLVVSSEDAMLSSDVKNEMNIARELNKRRVEFKIDDKPHTTFFKHFFDGHKWVDGIDRDDKCFSILCLRVFDELNGTNLSEKMSITVDTPINDTIQTDYVKAETFNSTIKTEPLNKENVFSNKSKSLKENIIEKKDEVKNIVSEAIKKLDTAIKGNKQTNINCNDDFYDDLIKKNTDPLKDFKVPNQHKTTVQNRATQNQASRQRNRQYTERTRQYTERTRPASSKAVKNQKQYVSKNETEQPSKLLYTSLILLSIYVIIGVFQVVFDFMTIRNFLYPLIFLSLPTLIYFSKMHRGRYKKLKRFIRDARVSIIFSSILVLYAIGSFM